MLFGGAHVRPASVSATRRAATGPTSYDEEHDCGDQTLLLLKRPQSGGRAPQKPSRTGTRNSGSGAGRRSRLFTGSAQRRTNLLQEAGRASAERGGTGRFGAREGSGGMKPSLFLLKKRLEPFPYGWPTER